MWVEKVRSVWQTLSAARREAPTYHSKFGGLWIDRSDWRREVERRRLSPDEAALVTQFAENGYVILPQACNLDAINVFQTAVAGAFRNGNAKVLYQNHFSHETLPLTGPVDRLGTRIVDAYISLPQSLDLFTSPALLDFLKLIFGENPLLFQSLSFDQGSQQGLHQDTAYVVVNNPLEFVACWIALEDIQEGSGELMYAPGSHRLPDWPFHPNRKHWDASAEGQAVHEEWSYALNAFAAESGRLQTFLPKKGDVLVWHADLAHGGSPVTRPELTRQSLVGHFCPQSAKPHYFTHGECRNTTRHYGDLAYSSEHFDLRNTNG
jgi:ectoine hydroxylase-related dioxygenase (phytanoyl-CoA dioxygenase family)